MSRSMSLQWEKEAWEINQEYYFESSLIEAHFSKIEQN